MRVVISGGCGFIGHHLVALLTDEGHDVWVVDNKTRAASGWAQVKRALPDGQLIRGDVTKPHVMDLAFRLARPEVVYHLAAESHVDESLKSPADAMFVNAVGTQVVASACVKYDTPMVYCSTDEVYGDLEREAPEYQCATEMFPLNPSSPYSAGKAAGEFAVMAACRSFGLRAAITRGCNAFGSGQYPEKLIPITCRLLQQGNSVPLHGGGNQVRQWIAVEEFVAALSIVGNSIGRNENSTWPSPWLFNLAGPEQWSVYELVEMFARALDLKMEDCIALAEDRPGQDMLYAVDGTSMDLGFGFVAKRRLSQEIRQLIEAYPQRGAVHLCKWGVG
jgi:dTDP-glucose 4,6-dehydratase